MRRKDKAAAPGVVAEVERQTAEAAALAGIAGQDRLIDPRTNPAVRGHADRLRDEQQVKALDAENARVERRLRVADRRADEAERTLEAIALAQRASSPARSVLALHTGRRLYTRLSLGASLALAAGSAMGVEAAAHRLHAPFGSGYIAEIGLTGLATVAITYRAHLAENRGELVKDSWQSKALWALMTVPLLISIGCNLATLNVVGAFCALGAAAFSLLSCVVADRSSAAMQARAKEVSDTDADRLRAVAMGDDLFSAVLVHQDEDDDADGDLLDGDVDGEADEGPALVMTVVDEVADEATEGMDKLAAWLADQEPPEESGPRPAVPPTSDDGPNSAAKTPPVPDQDDQGGVPLPIWDQTPWKRPEGHIVGRPGQRVAHIDGDQDDDPSGDPVSGGVSHRGPERGPERVQAAADARRAAGIQTRYELAILLVNHPDAGNSWLAKAMDVSIATVKRHRKELGFNRLTRDEQLQRVRELHAQTTGGAS